jgi:osmoprotectant transport system ATP-binding protein
VNTGAANLVEARGGPRDVTPDGSVLALRGVSLQVGGARLLHEIELTLERGQTGVLLGLSGAGKSSVLRLCVGLARPAAGAITFLGAPLDERSLASARRRIGYCIQDGGLFPHLSGFDNVALMPHQLGWDEPRLTQRIEGLCELVRLPRERLERFPGQLSGGERQRVSLMRALVLDPELLLLDEPFGALDPITRAELQDDLREVFRRLAKAVLLVTHDLHEASHFADWVALFRDGQIVQRGSLRELIEQPHDAFVRRFVAAQRVSLAPATDTLP